MKKIIYIFIIFIKNFIKNKNYNFFLYHDEISKISIDFWTGEACYVRGAKIGCFGRISEAYHTFLVLGPIDLTNGRAGMMNNLSFTLRGTKRYRILMILCVML
jgi:hypothetical protein